MRFAGLRKIVWIAGAMSACGVCFAATGKAGENQVDLELVITVDVSRPMDRDEATVARSGYIEAFRNPAVVEAIKRGTLGRIAVTFVEWSDPDTQKVVVPWTMVDGSASANDFADRLSQAPFQWLRSTSISGALLFSAGLIEKSGFAAPRRAIDVSGNGPNNAGGPVVAARAAVVARGITINGLPIDLGPREAVIANLSDYYNECVIGGPEAFLYPVTEVSQLPLAIRRKLIQEIAAAEPAQSRMITTVQATAVDCMIGEKLSGGAAQ